MRTGVEPSYEFGPFRLDPSEQRLTRDGVLVRVTPKTFAVLHVLVQNAGHLVDKDRLVAEVWPDSFVDDGALNRSISVLRKALGESADCKYIDTVPKRGYRFVAQVTVNGDGHVGDRPPPQPADRADEPSRRRLAAAGAILLTAAAVFLAVQWRATRSGNAGAPAPLAAIHRQVTFTGQDGGAALSPDGQRIAYISSVANERRVTVRELRGGTPRVILTAPEAGHLRWSPDGSELLVWARGNGFQGVYLIAQAGGTPRLIARGMYVACWIDDGSTIAVPSYIGGTIAFFDRTGMHLRTMSLQDVSWSIWDIDWSPRAGRLALTSSDEQGRFTLWTVRSDGREQTSILSSEAPIVAARWTPDGDAIYYLRMVNQTGSLDKVRLGEQPVSVLTGLETDGTFTLAADGRRLAYVRAPYHSNLWTIDLAGAGSGPRQLTQGTSVVDRPRISPDGRAIAFSMGRQPTANVYTMPIAGGPHTQLTFLQSLNVVGGWSADGRSIAFASTEGGTPRVWTISAAGGNSRPLPTGEMSESLDVSWSPGDAIFYQQPGNRNYRQIDSVNGAGQPLAADGSVGWIFSPVRSPDGSKTAVMWNRPPARGIWTIDTRTGEPRILYPASDSLRPIGWSPDGTAVYVLGGKLTMRGHAGPSRGTISDARIVMITAAGHARTVVTLPPGEIGGVAIAPDGRTLVYTMYSSGSDVWIVDDFDSRR